MILATAHGLTKRFPHDVTAFEGVDFEVQSHQITAIVGSPGAGKTTLLHCFAGMVELTAGTVHREAPLVALVATRAGSCESVPFVAAYTPAPQLVLISDEPTLATGSGVPYQDVAAGIARTMLRGFADLGHAVVVTTHDPQLIDLADNTVAL